MANTARCWSNRFGFSYHEWKGLSWWHKLRLYVLSHFYIQGDKCFWVRDSLMLTIRKCGFSDYQCICNRVSNPKRKCFCRSEISWDGFKQIVEIKQGVNDKVKHVISNREKKQ